MFWKDEAVSYDKTDSGNFSPSMHLLHLFVQQEHKQNKILVQKLGNNLASSITLISFEEKVLK